MAPSYSECTNKLVRARVASTTRTAAVSEHRALDAVMEHLDRHCGPVHEGGTVHLRHRPRRERLGVELTVKLAHGCAQLPFHQGDRESGRVCRHRRLQLRELFGDVLTDDVGPQAEHLPELDPRRPQLEQCPPEPLPRGQLGISGST